MPHSNIFLSTWATSIFHFKWVLPSPVKIYPFEIFTRATPGSSLVFFIKPSHLSKRFVANLRGKRRGKNSATFGRNIFLCFLFNAVCSGACASPMYAYSSKTPLHIYIFEPNCCKKAVIVFTKWNQYFWYALDLECRTGHQAAVLWRNYFLSTQVTSLHFGWHVFSLTTNDIIQVFLL